MTAGWRSSWASVGNFNEFIIRVVVFNFFYNEKVFILIATTKSAESELGRGVLFPCRVRVGLQSVLGFCFRCQSMRYPVS